MAADPHVVVDLLWLVGDLVAAPVVHMQQVAALREGVPDSPVRDALERWDQGYCPACGSWPALAEYFFGERLLRCAFCAATWRPPAHRCAYCGAGEDDPVTEQRIVGIGAGAAGLAGHERGGAGRRASPPRTWS